MNTEVIAHTLTCPNIAYEIESTKRKTKEVTGSPEFHTLSTFQERSTLKAGSRMMTNIGSDIISASNALVKGKT